MEESSLKAMCRQTDRMKVGLMVVEFVTPGIGHMLKNAGCDFVIFDMEHSAFGYETIKQGIRYAEAARLPAVVRTPSREYHHIARACDSGAEGVMLPMVGSAAEARSILDAIKYHGEGRRGVALGIAHDAYRGGAVLDKLQAANLRTTVIMQIETAEGVENADAMAAMDGVDCLWIGHFDLSCSLGIPGQFADPRFVQAVATVTEACRRHGKALGRLVADVPTGLDLHRAGFDMLSYSGDVWLFSAAVAEGVRGLREGATAAAPERPKRAARGKPA